MGTNEKGETVIRFVSYLNDNSFEIILDVSSGDKKIIKTLASNAIKAILIKKRIIEEIIPLNPDEYDSMQYL